MLQDWALPKGLRFSIYIWGASTQIYYLVATLLTTLVAYAHVQCSDRHAGAGQPEQ